ncbi:type II toxin-antitoxin system RelE/ParE family toxin [Candidatus Woesearchaeota archaeon]|nr:type II toxin-antitoxin system RelE/ParE family toxin [Candidatus Woesearchaeota archaeon]
MYKSIFSKTAEKKIQKLDTTQRKDVVKKIKDICENPFHEYKYLKNVMKGFQRVHIGHFVLVFRIEHQEMTVYFDNFDHHDKIYK